MEKVHNKENFYHRLALENGEEVAIYLGRNSGKQISADFFEAQKEILILSPYVSQSKISEMIGKANQNVDVKIAFCDKELLYKSTGKDILKSLIRQCQHIDQESVKRKNENLNKNKRFSVFAALLIIGMTVLSILSFVQMNYLFALICGFSLFVAVVWCSALAQKKQELLKIPIYRYTYHHRLNFKYMREFGDGQFIHSKIYIIDRKVAYVGSMNFTNNGFTSNFETRVRITNKDLIDEMVDFFQKVFDDSYNFPQHNTDWLGKRIYVETPY